jgi:iron-sulfur cluster insertion protein
MITITEKAAQKLIEISEAEGIGHYTVRAKIMGGGCAGFSYDMTFDDQTSDFDEVIELSQFEKTIKIVVDQISFQYLDGSTIDWIDGLIGTGFKFINPKATGSCGCGNSVSF